MAMTLLGVEATSYFWGVAWHGFSGMRHSHDGSWHGLTRVLWYAGLQ